MNPLLFPLIGQIIDKVGNLFPSEAEKNAAKIALLQAENNGELETLKVQLSAILAEAQSPDPWTSRARPSFMYVIYTMLLFGIPMGFVAAHDASLANAVTLGFKSWLAAIPDSLYTLFGVGYVGYSTARTVDKWKSNVN